MIHRIHTILQLWGGKMVVSTDDHFSHPLTKDTNDCTVVLNNIQDPFFLFFFYPFA